MQKQKSSIAKNAMERQLTKCLRLLVKEKEFLSKSEIELVRQICQMYDFVVKEQEEGKSPVPAPIISNLVADPMKEIQEYPGGICISPKMMHVSPEAKANGYI